MENRRVALIVGGLIGLVVAAAVAWWLISPLFINRTVNEDFPEIVIEEGQLVSPSMDDIAAMSDEERDEMEDRVQDAARDMPDRDVQDDMPSEDGEPVLIAQGMFVDADAFHQGEGTATIYQLPDGSYVLRFEDFRVTNGPDLHVFLSGSSEPASRGEVMTEPSVDLGMIKGNVGSQNYEIPAGVDIENVQSVVIYCVPFSVIFSTAALQ
ncbi:MAG: DM13 domain-containing protein [Chloroflexi bacterium]|nr:DM13 domain-containing protein [Chloroflexota bacterium]